MPNEGQIVTKGDREKAINGYPGLSIEKVTVLPRECGPRKIKDAKEDRPAGYN